MSLNEAITEGLMVTAVGLIIVFSVLAILMIALMIMKAVFYKPVKKVETIKKEVKTVEQPANIQTSVSVGKQDDYEIIAVLTAAIAASLNTSVSNLRLKSYKRVGTNSPAWNRAGVSEMINTRL